MQQKVIPLLVPPLRKSKPEEAGVFETTKRGMAVLTTPLLNKGSAFTREERESLGLVGLLPPVISSLVAQVASAYSQYQRLPDVLSKNIYLTALHDRNEVLFFRLLSEHLREMIPIVNDRTVGLAMEQYHHESRRPRGVYLSIDEPDGIEAAFANLQAGPDDIDIILATDAGQIFGIGDWGVGGIEIAIGKLAIYTAAGGIDPARVIPVMIDVGTDRESLRNDGMYPGNRHARVRGDRYDAFIDDCVETSARLFPHALLQLEDFAPGNARRILHRCRGRFRTFSDDLQGTGAITLAAAVSAMRVCGTPLRNQRVVIFGAGTAGIGIADLLSDVMVAEGLSEEAARRRFWCLDSNGLLIEDMGGELCDHQIGYARPAAEVNGWKREGCVGLAEVVHQVRPTMLIGASGIAGAFTEPIIREMAWHTDRPTIFPLSSPASLAEATPADLIDWTDGRALIATGGSFTPVTHKGITHVIGQLNNAMLYPGVGLGTIVSRAKCVSVGMLVAAANALSSLVAVRLAGATLLPHIENLRSVTVTVAVAVAEAAVHEGLAGVRLADIVQQVEDAMWHPEYRRIKAS
ncbi:MAG TPA: NAD-dependent malic enzyme [Bryobacteraceae bacterium]|jgi:malate dehydrogenase (oxaloacetate-decarboxylating)|nr:NAD-dependent malic enzyme [Bryobacteraceae bacterium]